MDCADPDAAAAALSAASARLRLVTQDGREHPSIDELLDFVASPEGKDAQGVELCSPNSVSAVEWNDDRQPWIRLDTKDGMCGPMARTMIHIVVEQLAAAGISRARVSSRPVEVDPAAVAAAEQFWSLVADPELLPRLHGDTSPVPYG